MQKKNPGHPYLTFFTGLPVTLNTQLLFYVSYACIFYLMYVYKIFLIYLICEKKLDSLLTDIKSSPSFTNNIVGV